MDMLWARLWAKSTSISFDPKRDIPSQTNKVFFITGGTNGLGAEAIRHLIHHSPSQIYFSGRDSTRADALVAELASNFPSTKLTFIQCDLGSLASVAAAAKRVLAESPRLDVLMCNAGIAAAPPALTQDGYELQFGTNHVGHALLIKLLLSLLLQTAEKHGGDARVVTLTSQAYLLKPRGGILFSTLKTPQVDIPNTGLGGAWTRYGQSKFANLAYAAELARRYPQLVCVSIHPGIVGTDLIGRLDWMNKAIIYMGHGGRLGLPAQGAWNQVWAATTGREMVVNGAYYEPVGDLKKVDAEAGDVELAGRLWDWTQKELEGWN